jgi:hypothetical protein
MNPASLLVKCRFKIVIVDENVRVQGAYFLTVFLMRKKKQVSH